MLVTVNDDPSLVKKESPKEIPKESPKESPKETLKESTKESLRESPKESLKESPKESANVTVVPGNQHVRDAGVVQYLISKKKTQDRLLELLQLGDPTFVEEDLENSERRQKAWRRVISLIHPDQNKEDDATRLFQDAQNWYSSVCKKVQVDPPEQIAEFPVATYQDKYDFFEDYPHLKHWHPWRSTSGLWGEEFWAAVACINLRGAFACQKCPEISFSLSQLLEFAQDIEAETTNMIADIPIIFKKFGGCKEITNNDNEIKKHIRTKGPVVSLSFKPSAAAIAEFPEIDVEPGCTNTVIILGWKSNLYGNSWTVYLPSTARTIDVACGQNCITDKIVYPGRSMDKLSWEPGPYFPIDMSKWDVDFRSWTNFSIHLTDERFEELLEFMGKGRIVQKCNADHPFVLRDTSLYSKTIKVHVSDIEFDPECIIGTRPYTVHLFTL